MFNFALTLILTICLSILCVYISNIRIHIPHKRKKAFLSHFKDQKRQGTGLDYVNPHLKSNAQPLNAHSWHVEVTGHS